MHRVDGRNYYVFGRAGFGSLQSVQEYFVTTNEIKRALFYPEYHEPNEILFIFFVGQLISTIISARSRGVPIRRCRQAILSTGPWTRFRSFRRRKEFYLPLLELLVSRLLRKALHFSNPEPQPSDPNNFIRFQDGTLRQFVVENPQAASVELDAQKTDLAMQVLRQSLVRLKNQSSSIPIKVVYIPSVTTSYTWKGPIKFRAYQWRGPLFTSTEEYFLLAAGS